MSALVRLKAHDLAEEFLTDRNERRVPTKADVRDLAETIQQAMELWFCANNDSDTVATTHRSRTGLARKKLYEERSPAARIAIRAGQKHQ